jgi:hypothetical protein
MNRSIPAILFRTESYSGSGVRDIQDVIEYEMSELRNKDIPRYVLEHYDIDEALRLDLQAILRDDPAGEYPFLGDGAGHGVGDRPDLQDLISRMVDAVSAVLGQNLEDGRHVNAMRLRYALWLAPLRAVCEHYVRSDGSTQAYATASRTLYSPEPVVLSDLGDEGVLLAFVDEPQPLPDPVRYELCEWPDSQAVMDLPFALPADHPEFDSAWLFPQDYIQRADGQEPLLGEPFYRIAWPFAQKAEERFHELGMPVADLLHIVDSQDVFVSEKLLNKLITEDDSYEVGIFLQRNFLNPHPVGHEVIVNRIQPEVTIPDDADDILGYYYWGHYFELAGKRGYASNYGYGTNIRELEDGTTEDSFRNAPDEDLHKKFWQACKAYGLPCGNITFNF